MRKYRYAADSCDKSGEVQQYGEPHSPKSEETRAPRAIRSLRLCLAVQKFTSIGAQGWIRGPKSCKISLCGKDSPRMGEPFDRFLQNVRAFTHPTTVHNCFKFDVIRFADYGIIAEKPRVCHIPQFFSVHPLGKPMR